GSVGGKRREAGRRLAQGRGSCGHAGHRSQRAQGVRTTTPSQYGHSTVTGWSGPGRTIYRRLSQAAIILVGEALRRGARETFCQFLVYIGPHGKSIAISFLTALE